VRRLLLSDSIGCPDVVRCCVLGDVVRVAGNDKPRSVFTAGAWSFSRLGCP